MFRRFFGTLDAHNYSKRLGKIPLDIPWPFKKKRIISRGKKRMDGSYTAFLFKEEKCFKMLLPCKKMIETVHRQKYLIRRWMLQNRIKGVIIIIVSRMNYSWHS